MKSKFLKNCAVAVVLPLMLSACLHDNGGMSSTPTPTPPAGGGGTPSPSPAPAPAPSPSPSPSPTPSASEGAAPALGHTSNTSFDAVTAEFAVRPPSTIYGEQDAEPVGEGTQIDYDASADSYTFTRSDGVTVTVTPDDIDADGQLTGEGGLFGSSEGTVYVVEDGDITHTVAIVPPGTYEGITMNYMAISLWNRLDESGMAPANEVQWQIWGNPTETMPTTGTATYSLDGAIGANGFDSSAGVAGAAYDFLNGDSTGELGVDFGSGDISVDMHLIGFDYVANASSDFGNFGGSGSITSGAAYSGTFDAGGEFHGSFFGPNAEETGFGFFIDNGTLMVTGVAAGFQQ